MGADNPLGQQVSLPQDYEPGLLHPLRRPDRKVFPEGTRGADVWRIWDLVWRDRQGVPHRGVLDMRVPWNSPFMVESKSLKLYLWSCTHVAMDDVDAFLCLVRRDLERCLGVAPELKLVARPPQPSEPPAGAHLLFPTPRRGELPAARAALYPEKGLAEGGFTFSPFLSLCPVTGQPDYATVHLGWSGGWGVREEQLAAYLSAHDGRPGYHEACCEQIYGDLLERVPFQTFWISCHFTRRGGIDISPWRALGCGCPTAGIRDIWQ